MIIKAPQKNKTSLLAPTNSGFSLIELLIALSISSLLAMLAVNGFNHLINRVKADTELSELTESFALARQTAISSRLHVSVCGSSDGSQCDQGWQNGFIVFQHGGQQKTFINNASTPLLYHHKPAERFVLKSNNKIFTFRPSGLLKGKAGSLLYCPKQEQAKLFHRIAISRGGRIRAYSAAQLKKIKYLSKMSC